MAKQKQPDEAPRSLTTALEGLESNPLPTTAEDFDAEVARQAAEDAALDRVNELIPVEDTGPNPDQTPGPVSDEPWWECTCPEAYLPKRLIQAPSAQMAEDRYKTYYNVRRPKVEVKQLEPA